MLPQHCLDAGLMKNVPLLIACPGSSYYPSFELSSFFRKKSYKVEDFFSLLKTSITAGGTLLGITLPGMPVVKSTIMLNVCQL